MKFAFLNLEVLGPFPEKGFGLAETLLMVIFELPNMLIFGFSWLVRCCEIVCATRVTPLLKLFALGLFWAKSSELVDALELFLKLLPLAFF